MKTFGIILIIAGIIGVIIFGIQAINDSESFSLFGMDVAVSTANWTPLIASALVVFTGSMITLAKKSG
ncbi:MAG: transglycosylase [Draconibacterium sp.]|jgi:hypothetical protein